MRLGVIKAGGGGGGGGRIDPSLFRQTIVWFERILNALTPRGLVVLRLCMYTPETHPRIHSWSGGCQELLRGCGECLKQDAKKFLKRMRSNFQFVAINFSSLLALFRVRPHALFLKYVMHPTPLPPPPPQFQSRRLYIVNLYA